MSQYPATSPGTPLQPHRGTLVLVLGIISLVAGCTICGIIAWVLGHSDLKAMDAGRMDPSGRGMTQAGKICGMISCIVAILLILFYVVVVLIMGVAIFAAGNAGTGP